MSWQIPLYAGVLYLCLGLAILSVSFFNNELGTAAIATATVTISTFAVQPIPTGFAAGYIPYKPSALPWLDDMGTAWAKESPGGIERRKQQRTGVHDKRWITDVDDPPYCQIGKKSCHNLGHPEICCNEDHTCLPTNNTLTGVYCCRSPDPVTLPCDDTNLRCELDWYQCPASANGGCCKYGQRCGPLECYDGGGPTAPAMTPATTTLSNPDFYGGSITASRDNTNVEGATIHYTPGANTTVTITSTSIASTATVATPLTTDSPTTTASDRTLSTTTRNGVSVSYTVSNPPVAPSAHSAAGSRAKVGRHWSWAVMSWWLIAAIVEGV